MSIHEKKVVLLECDGVDCEAEKLISPPYTEQRSHFSREEAEEVVLQKARESGWFITKGYFNLYIYLCSSCEDELHSIITSHRAERSAAYDCDQVMENRLENKP